MRGNSNNTATESQDFVELFPCCHPLGVDAPSSGLRPPSSEREKDPNGSPKKARWPSAWPTGFRESCFSIRGDGRDDDGVRLRVHCALLHAVLVRRAPCDPRLLGVTAVDHRLQMRVGPAELHLDLQNRLAPLARCRLGFRRPRGSSEAIHRRSVYRHCFCPAS